MMRIMRSQGESRALSAQGLEQRLGLLQVGRLKSLREPAVHLGQQLLRLGALDLVLPEAAQAQRRPLHPRQVFGTREKKLVANH
jgi:hypothetical protein